MNSEKNLKNKKPRKKPFENFFYDFVKVTGAIPAMLWLRPKVYYPHGNPKPKGSVLISANHRSLLDPIIVHMAFTRRRLNCLATKDLFNTKLKASFFTKMHCIIVDKENFSLSSFHAVVNNLKAGKAVVIFPEGQVNFDNPDAILAFKSGAVLMAQKAGAPILPVYIARRKKWYHRQRIVVGSPVDIKSLMGAIPSMQEMNTVSETLREKELELREYFESLPIYQKLNSKEKAVKV